MSVTLFIISPTFLVTSPALATVSFAFDVTSLVTSPAFDATSLVTSLAFDATSLVAYSLLMPCLLLYLTLNQMPFLCPFYFLEFNYNKNIYNKIIF
jgi:hypothetical protein